jgi:endonuclease YncB( thermonuclease family)
MSRILLFLALTLATPLTAQTAKVIDGDTLHVGDEKIRLFGIDAPEKGQTCTGPDGKAWACGLWAAEQLQEKLEGGSLTCRGQDRDRYGRLLATCTVDGRDVAKDLVEEGAVLAFRRYSSRYVGAENSARAAGRGVWSGEMTAPWTQRAKKSQPVTGAAGDCSIKGNISNNGRIYHLPGQEHYNKTRISQARGERWFCSEAEARAAGWRRARR